MGLVFFLVYITGVIVLFIFFCRFSNNLGGLIFKPGFSIIFFLLARDGVSILSCQDKKNVYQSAEFYFISEIGQIFLLGV